MESSTMEDVLNKFNFENEKGLDFIPEGQIISHEVLGQLQIP